MCHRSCSLFSYKICLVWLLNFYYFIAPSLREHLVSMRYNIIFPAFLMIVSCSIYIPQFLLPAPIFIPYFRYLFLFPFSSCLPHLPLLPKAPNTNESSPVYLFLPVSRPLLFSSIVTPSPILGKSRHFKPSKASGAKSRQPMETRLALVIAARVLCTLFCPAQFALSNTLVIRMLGPIYQI